MKRSVNEEFRDVPGFPGYRIGSRGTFLSCRSTGGQPNKTQWRVLNPRCDPHGYVIAKLCRDGKVFVTRTHSLVLIAFVGPRPDGAVCCHGNGIKDDNRVENLRWGSILDNIADREMHGTTATGEQNGRSKLTWDTVRQIRSLRAGGMRLRDIGALFGLGKNYVQIICAGKIWKDNRRREPEGLFV